MNWPRILPSRSSASPEPSPQPFLSSLQRRDRSGRLTKWKRLLPNRNGRLTDGKRLLTNRNGRLTKGKRLLTNRNGRLTNGERALPQQEKGCGQRPRPGRSGSSGHPAGCGVGRSGQRHWPGRLSLRWRSRVRRRVRNGGGPAGRSWGLWHSPSRGGARPTRSWAVVEQGLLSLVAARQVLSPSLRWG